MRKISIKTDTGNLDIFDDSDVPMDQYCNDLSKIMKMNNIVTLQTTESSVIVRPSKIIGIQIKELFLEDDLQDIEGDKKEEVSLDINEDKNPETPKTEETSTEKVEEKIQSENSPPNPEENQEQKDKTEDIITDVD